MATTIGAKEAKYNRETEFLTSRKGQIIGGMAGIYSDLENRPKFTAAASEQPKSPETIDTPIPVKSDTSAPAEPDTRIGGSASIKKNNVKAEKVGTSDFDKMEEYLKDLEKRADYLRRYKEAAASIAFTTDPRTPTELTLAIGSDTKEVFKEAMKKLGSAEPVPPNLLNTDPNQNALIINAALASLTAAVGGTRTGDGLAGATGALGVMSGGMEGQAKLIREKQMLNATLQKEYQASVKSYAGSIEKMHNEFLKETGLNERKLLDIAARHWNDKEMILSKEKEITLNQQKAELEQKKFAQGANQDIIENEIKKADLKLRNLKAKTAVRTANADRNLNAARLNAFVARTSIMQTKALNAKYPTLRYAKTDRVDALVPDVMYAKDQLMKSDRKRGEIANSRLFKHSEKGLDIINYFSKDEFLKDPGRAEALDKVIENVLGIMKMHSDSDRVIADYNPQFLLNAQITKIDPENYIIRQPEGLEPIYMKVEDKDGEDFPELRSQAIINWGTLLNNLLARREEVVEQSYNSLLQPIKVMEMRDKMIIHKGVKDLESRSMTVKRFIKTGMTEKQAEEAANKYLGKEE